MQIPVFVSTDKNYCIPTVVTLASIAENTKSNVAAYILHSELEEKDKKLFKGLTKKYTNLFLEFVKIDELEFKEAKKCSYLTAAAYYRMAIPNLKKNLPLAIYFDVDMVVNFDIKELFELDLEGKPLAAVQEKGMIYLEYFAKHSRDLNIDNEKYFNSGLLVINLEYFRKNNLVDKMFQTANLIKDDILCADQDIFNYLFYDNYTRLDYRYNVHMQLEELLEKNNDPDIEAFKNPKIYHFSSGKKPWNSRIKYDGIWFKYALKSLSLGGGG